MHLGLCVCVISAQRKCVPNSVYDQSIKAGLWIVSFPLSSVPVAGLFSRIPGPDGFGGVCVNTLRFPSGY